MDRIEGDKLFQISSQLESVIEALASVREKIERRGASGLVDEYFEILIALQRISEAKERLVKVAEDQKQKEGAKRERLFTINT